MKRVRKLIPVSLYDIQGLESWLEEQADQGLFPVSLGSWAVFEERAVPGTRFRLDPFANRMGEGLDPSPEKLELYRQAGWKYAFPIGQAYFLFYNTDPSAPELYTDYQSQGLSLERLKKRLRAYHRRQWIILGLIPLTILIALFWPCEFDAQPAPLARLPLILLYLFHPSLLCFLAVVCFRIPIERRDWHTLSATYNALKEGLPPPSPGPSRRIVLENRLSLTLTPILLLLLLFNLTSGKSNVPLNEFTAPYVSLSEMEHVKTGWVPDPDENSTTRQFSLLAPTWYEVRQRSYGQEMGRENGFSPDPQDGRYTYTPSLNMTYFRLLLPVLARPVANAQLDYYRAVNLTWTYRDVDWPGTDFVILAADSSDSTFQMAAIARGGRVAVFRYSGMENLEEHLDKLAEIVT